MSRGSNRRTKIRLAGSAARSGRADRKSTSQPATEQFTCGNPRSRSPQPFLRLRIFSAQAFESAEKFRERDAHAIGVANNGIAFASERGNGEGHGNAMIALRCDLGTVELSGRAPFDAQPIGKFLHTRAHLAQALCQRGDAVAFLYAQFLGVM